MPFIPHTQGDVEKMLEAIQVDSIADLFDEIPEDLKITELKNVPAGSSEMDLAREMRRRALQDIGVQCFIGAGAYEHHIPAAVWEIATRGEFLTAYTPYQAEASQGTLQLIYEFQTMIVNLLGMEVSNASLYDGATSFAESVLMAVRLNRKSKARRILVPRSLHPAYREVVKSCVTHQNIEIVELDFSLETGETLESELAKYKDEDITAVAIPQPNFFGRLEQVDAITTWAHERNALVIGIVNPVAMAFIKEPGSWGDTGADIVCGEGQPLGIPLASGGPYYGFMATRLSFARQMPGRIVGRTVDLDGKEGFALTLQAREQHIRRSKATSNICTNQGLAVTASTIHMSLLGAQGLQNVALKCHDNLYRFIQAIEAESMDVEIMFNGANFHEVVLRFKQDVSLILKSMLDQGILGGYDLSEAYPELKNCLLVCVTETKNDADIQAYVKALATALQSCETEIVA